MLLFAGNPVAWVSSRQSTVAFSTAESEYIALFTTTKEAVWLKQLYTDFGHIQSKATTINVDNLSASIIANNGKSGKTVKHMKIKYHYVREMIDKKVVATINCPADIMLADVLTKSLSRQRFETLRANSGVGCL